MNRFITVLLSTLLFASVPATAGTIRATVADRDLADGSSVVRMPRGMAVITSTKSFDDTYNDLVAALTANPNIKVIKEIDHSAAAANVGLTLTPTKVVYFGNPNLGSPIMLQDQRAGLDLPQKMLVWEEDGQIYLSYNSVDYLETRYEDIEGTATLATIEGALANFAGVATGVEVGNIKAEAVMSPKEINKLRKLGRRGALRTETSDSDFTTTLDRLRSAIQASPANIALELDHSANANNNGFDLGPTTLLVFGNPNLGTPLMQADPSVGIDLPLKMLVWEDDDGTVLVTTNAPCFLESRHGLEGVDPQINAAQNAISNFLNAATTTPN